MMLYRDICKILSYYFWGFSLAFIFPFFVALYYQFVASAEIHPQPHASFAFLLALVVCLVFAWVSSLFAKGSTGRLYRREGILVVVLIWFITPLIAAVPYLASGTLTDPLQAYFEGASGLTTTGATVMYPKKYNKETGEEEIIYRTVVGVHNTKYAFYGTIEPVRDAVTGQILHEGIEAVSKAVLFWRSMTQWLGGMGIIVLFVAVLPALGVGGKQLFYAEMPGPIKDSLTPRIKETALNLWKIYLGISLLEIISLKFVNHDLPWFDLVTITFSTVSTGGFTPLNASIGTFQSDATEWVIILFMVLSSINFSLYYFAFKGKVYRLYDPELLIYLVVLAFGCGLCTYFIYGKEQVLLTGEHVGKFSLDDSFRAACFQVISAQTTTGFTTVNYEIWPYTAQVIMLIVMFLGGMAGSTAGGLKMMRHFMLFRIAQYKVESIFRPETVRSFRVGDRDVDAGASIRVLCFFLIAIVVATIGVFLFIMDGLDPESALAVVACMINNIGIGFRIDGPTESCAFLSDFGLILSSFLMVLGRLEYFAVIALFVPVFWKQNV